MNHQLSPHVATFMADLKANGIAAQDIEPLCSELHAATIELPEFTWVTTNFEQIGDCWTVALECTAETK